MGEVGGAGERQPASSRSDDPGLAGIRAAATQRARMPQPRPSAAEIRRRAPSESVPERPDVSTPEARSARLLGRAHEADRVTGSRRLLPGVLARGHVLLWLWIVAGVFVVGCGGYIVLFGWSFSDAAYMTIITLTTEGYREVRELSDLGRAWTAALSIAGVGIIFGTVGIVVESFVRELTSARREERRMSDTIRGLRDHYILCGYGRVGSTVARELVARGHRVVVVDLRQESLETARRDGHLIVRGDAADDATLVEAGIERAHALVTTLDSDANNVYVTLSARALQPNLFILARANMSGSESKLEQAGADRVVSPYTMAGRRIAEFAIRPKLAEFIDLALSTGEEAFSLEEVEVVAGGPLDGRTVGDLRTDGVFTLAILPEGGAYQANPTDDRRLAPGENLVLSGTSPRLRALRDA